MWVRCLPSAQLKSEEEKRDTSRNRGPRAGALFLFLFETLFLAVRCHTISADSIPAETISRVSAAAPEKRGRHVERCGKYCRARSWAPALCCENRGGTPPRSGPVLDYLRPRPHLARGLAFRISDYRYSDVRLAPHACPQSVHADGHLSSL